MIKEKRAKELFDKAVYKMRTLVSLSPNAPINKQIELRAYCIIWELKQKYRGVKAQSYMPKKAYNAHLKSIETLQGNITGESSTNALEAVSEAREYLEILAVNLIRDTRRCRVY